MSCTKRHDFAAPEGDAETSETDGSASAEHRHLDLGIEAMPSSADMERIADLFMLGVDWEREARIEQYRHRVERLLGTRLSGNEDEIDAFLDHVEACFSRGSRERSCATDWLRRRN
jgi:hypothetical protein